MMIPMPLLADAVAAPASPGFAVILVLGLFISASVWLGTMAQRIVEKSKFEEGFFLGNRGLGAWALALTATVQSGGTFMGYPAFVYRFGWVALLWIGAYMVVPLTAFALLGKRIAHISRRADALTMPDLFRARFDSPAIGLLISLLMMVTLSMTMIAQFKAGATIMKLAWPGQGMITFAEDAQVTFDSKFYEGLVIFTICVVGYTMIGGFTASVWTDLFQSVMMVFGVAILLTLTLQASGGLESGTRTAIQQIGKSAAAAKERELARSSPDLEAAAVQAEAQAASVRAQQGYLFGPGRGRQFLPVTMAISMFFVWIYGGIASPASVVRVMAAQNTEVMRKSVFLLSVYNCGIYIPLAVIAVCAHAVLQHEAVPDEMIPTLALQLTQSKIGGAGGQLIAGLILAAPFGAIMASVSCFVLVIASGIVEDVYHRVLNPQATEQQLKRLTRITMTIIGIIGIVANIAPVPFLQALVVFSSSAGGATLCVPAFMACYWRRANAPGVIAAMVGGFSVFLGLYVIGWIHNYAVTLEDPGGVLGFFVQQLGGKQPLGSDDVFRPFWPLGFDPMIWGLLSSLSLGVLVTKLTPPPRPELVQKFFDR